MKDLEYLQTKYQQLEDTLQSIPAKYSSQDVYNCVKKCEELKLASPNFRSYVKRRVSFLKKSLNQWNYEYYGLQRPSVPDAIYDSTLKELTSYETLFPEFATKDSPTKHVGGAVSNKFKKIPHQLPMLSLGNIFDYDELLHFDKTARKLIRTNKNSEYYVEPKLDGLSISLIYNKGKLAYGLTRGDGKIGEDVTQNLKMISSIPQHIDNNLDRFEVRGEIYITFEQFKKINDAIKDEDKKFANPRNAAAGTLRRLDPELVKSRNMKMAAYYIPDPNNVKALGITKQSEVIEQLRKYGFHTAKETYKVSDVQSLYEKIKYLEKHQDDLEYPIDGAVIKVNEIALYSKLGTTSKFPHWATAYKFVPKEAETKVLDIIANVGRTGKITYVAKLTPVFLSGSTISSATLNNAEYIASKDIRLNDTVKIFKAAEIIPYVKEAVLSKRPKDSKPFKAIINCPVCGSKLEKREGEVDQYCINTSCPARILSSILHFCSKTAMNIEGLSEKTLGKYFELGYIKSIPDIYHLNEHRQEIITKVMNDKFKVFNKIQDAIEKSKSNSLEKLLVGIGIRDVGAISALALAKHFKSIDNLMKATKEELINLKDVGDVVSTSIYDWTHNASNIDLIKKLKDVGVNMNYINSAESLKNINSPYYQKNFCITGSFDIPREQIKEKLIAKYDANVSSSVNKSTDYLIVGANGGSKQEKAEKLNIKIIRDKIWEDN